MNIYTAITIGPIYKTMQIAKRTREAWQASYFFSYVMKCLVEEAKKKGSIILPADNDEGKYFGAGIYPDRLIMTSNSTFDVEKNIIIPALQTVSKNLKINIDHLNNYLNIHFIQANESDLSEFELKDDNGNVISSFIHKLNYLLNIKELNQTYAHSDTSFYKDLFDDTTRKEFYKIAFSSKKHKFNSIFDITAQGNEYVQDLIKQNESKNDPDEILFNDENIENKLTKHQKYLAILQADGDNFGKVISAIGNDNAKVAKFSNDLVLFSQQASTIINDFGGTIIYIGGDDILAFCPLVNGDKNIFQLVNELNNSFHNQFKADMYKTNKVSLSYGLAISYYKYPLNEALENAYELLMYKAKKQALKNCIAFQILQNSGSLRETILNFAANGNFDSFLSMLNTLSEKEQLLQSLTHQLMEDSALLESCLKGNQIDGYFDNHYNPETKKKEVKDFILSMQANLKANYTLFEETNLALINEGKNQIEDIENKTLVQMNTIARAIKFLN